MESVKRCVKPRHYTTFKNARDHSNRLAGAVGDVITEYMNSRSEALGGMCFAVVGSVGRREALNASDIDLIPVAVDGSRLQQYEPHDAELRRLVESRLKVKVSKGKDLTKATSIEELVAPDSIGGPADDSGRLTKRVLLLT